MDTKLQIGDKIKVIGWCMLNKLDEGEYRISNVELVSGQPVYSFTRPKGKKVIIRHYARNVDPWLKDTEDLNKIIKI